ncbi:hypothetical protein DNTS_033559 [Danionella cerebrum]|uniref:Uncharacterized protein n=1 Tax=Danionella cerebrum TaxID=2873325 RepID=A0A553N1P0_9TELE|nr:hypothetical protein DNTS_033559 [Danionella translucida]
MHRGTCSAWIMTEREGRMETRGSQAHPPPWIFVLDHWQLFQWVRTQRAGQDLQAVDGGYHILEALQVFCCE